MYLAPYQIISILNKLGIEHENTPNTKGWLLCKCVNPYHYDKTMSNAGINLNNGVFNCFSCGHKKHIIGIVMERLSYTYFDALDFCGQLSPFSHVEEIKPIIIEKEKIEKDNIALYDFTYVTLNPDKYYYTKLRGFTKEFCKQFNITHCLSSGKYSDYFIIPVIDTKKGISIFEARKLMEYEYLCKYYNADNINIERLRKIFKREKEENNYVLKKEDVSSKNGKINNYVIQYILKRKVLYPFNSPINETVWNIDNLNYDESLWVCEGFGTIPKLYQNISKNCTCLFGSNISQYQIEYLKKFKKGIIVIPDWDVASDKLIANLHTNKLDIWVCPVKSEDTDNNFIYDVSNTQIIEGNRFLFRTFTL